MVRQVTSVTNGGASVYRLARMTNVQAVMNRPHHAPTSARSHVLAVDDDPLIREAISDYLGQHDFRITAVADGRAMQAVLAEDVVDLVVLDLKLRDEDGMALASRLRRALETAIVKDNVRTKDLGGSASTTEFARAVARRL